MDPFLLFRFCFSVYGTELNHGTHGRNGVFSRALFSVSSLFPRLPCFPCLPAFDHGTRNRLNHGTHVLWFGRIFSRTSEYTENTKYIEGLPPPTLIYLRFLYQARRKLRWLGLVLSP
jgi:hypothetical protein